MTPTDESTSDKKPKPKDNRPEVFLSLNEGFVADQVVSHLGKLGWESTKTPKRIDEARRLFVRGGVLVQATESDAPDKRGQLSIRPLPSSIVRERITQSCKLQIKIVSGDKEEIVLQRPTKWLIDAVQQRGFYDGKIKPLAGIIQSPTIRPDGSIIQTAGYDETTSLLYVPNATYKKIPDKPTRDDALKAIERLYEVVVDFPFLNDADRSAWLCLVLSMIARCCIRGCCPLFAITANVRGSGKTLLVDAASIIAFARSAARKAFTRDDDETRKLITSIALEAIASVLFDNLDVQLGGASLDAAITSDTWTDRLLGTNRTTGDLPLRPVWTATGNNMSFGSDVGRRVLCVRLQSPLEAPENRSGFVHADLLGWVSQNRPRLAVAALTVLRAYFVAGCPEQSGGEWGSFESWSKIIRGAVVWAGAADPLITRATANENDDTKNLLAMLITGLNEADPDGAGLTTKEIERLTTHRPDEMPVCPTLIEAVAFVCGDRFNAKRFGNRMRSFAGRVWDKQRITGESGHGGVKRWAVEIVDGGFAGSAVGLRWVSKTQTNHDSQGKTRGESVNGGFGGFQTEPLRVREQNSPNSTELEPGKTKPPKPPTHHETKFADDSGVEF